MGYEVSYNRALHIVEILFVGELSTAALKEATFEIIRVGLEQGCTDFLLDSRMQVGVRSMADRITCLRATLQQVWISRVVEQSLYRGQNQCAGTLYSGKPYAPTLD
jgi:hypothetical protein